MLAAGATFGQYEVLAKLKSGGMATLFLGRRVGAAGFRRHVAIKVVHEHLASDASFVRMFVDEALLQARIHHPNVVHVEELGERDGQHFLVMEYVHGCSLAQLMKALATRDRRMTPEMAASIAAHVLAGLHAAHELRDEKGALLGVVHRDVSPQNVLLAYEGHVKLIDFGVAKAKNRQSTVGGSLKGKLRYMSPEQAYGRPVDRRCDLYAIGIVLWEMLTLSRLFHADEDLALLDMVRSPQIVPPSARVPGISPALDAVVMKALAPRAEDRYATAQDMRRAIAEAVPGALLLDASNLAELLAAVMKDEIDRDRAALPQSVSAVIANVDRRNAIADRADEALKTMTISAAGIDYLGDEAARAEPRSSSGVRASESPAAPDVAPAPADGAVSLASRPSHPSQPSSASRPSQVSQPSQPSATFLMRPAEGAPGAGRWIALGVAAVVVVALAITGALAALGRGGGEGTMVATPLAPSAGASSPSVPPGVATPPPHAAPEPAERAASQTEIGPPAEPVPRADAARQPDPRAESARATAGSARSGERGRGGTRPATRTPRTRARAGGGPGGVPLADEF